MSDNKKELIELILNADAEQLQEIIRAYRIVTEQASSNNKNN